MKYHIAFLTGLCAVLGMFSYFIFSLSEKGPFYIHDRDQELNQVLVGFRESYQPKITINLSTLYRERGQLQVLHPILDVSQLQIANVRQLCGGEGEASAPGSGSDASCTPRLEGETVWSIENIRRKTDTLVHFLYGNGELPITFLGSAPFLDKQGNSFAYLLVKKGPPPFNQKDWIENHLSFFKVSELKDLLSSYNIDEPHYRIISEFSDTEIERAVRGEQVILTPKYLLLRDQSRFGFSPLSYLVYDLSVFKTAISYGDFDLVPASANAYCIQKIGNACWTYSSKYALSYLYKYSVAIVVILGLVFLLFFAFYLKRIYEKNKEQQKHRLSLQVLSHEFRTPVSSLLLMIDQLREGQQKLEVKDQDLVTRISTEIFRLQRIVEVSKTYLQAEGGRIHFSLCEIPSANIWIADFIEESRLKIECEPLLHDQSFEADPFWLKFVLSNLVQNAFAHGAEPVRIKLENSKGPLKITVQDQGLCEYQSLSKMTEAFVKSQKSKGMGLGLNIVKYIVDELGIEIQFTNQPTSFTLFLQKSKLKGI